MFKDSLAYLHSLNTLTQYEKVDRKKSFKPFRIYIFQYFSDDTAAKLRVLTRYKRKYIMIPYPETSSIIIKCINKHIFFQNVTSQ